MTKRPSLIRPAAAHDLHSTNLTAVALPDPVAIIIGRRDKVRSVGETMCGRSPGRFFLGANSGRIEPRVVSVAKFLFDPLPLLFAAESRLPNSTQELAVLAHKLEEWPNDPTEGWMPHNKVKEPAAT
jgi:hypothetical protein